MRERRYGKVPVLSFEPAELGLGPVGWGVYRH